MENKFDAEPMIQAFRDSRLTYQEIADMTNVSKPTAFRVLGKGEIPKVEHLLRLCDALGIATSKLFKRTEK